MAASDRAKAIQDVAQGHAEPATLSIEDQRRIAEARDLAAASRTAAHEIAPSLPARPSFEQLKNALGSALGSAPSPTAPTPAAPTTVVLVSQAMSEGDFEALRGLVAVHPHLELAFAGFLPGQKLSGLARVMNERVHGGLAHHWTIDPTLFVDTGVSQVPALVRLDADRRPVAWLRGRLNPDDLTGRAGTGDLGTDGPTRPISELNLLEVLSARFAALRADPDEKRARFGRTVPMISLPRARAVHETHLVPQLLSVPVRDQHGQVIIEGGQRISPLAAIAAPIVLYVVDATDAVQRQAAPAQLPAGAHVLVSALDRERFFDDRDALETELGRPVYLYTAELHQRLGLTALPALVTIDSGGIQTRTLPPEES